MSEPIETSTTEAATTSWRQQLRDAVRDLHELERLLGFEPGALEERSDSTTTFPLLVPRAFVGRMQAGNANDPLLRQVLPASEERRVAEGFCDDPLSEQPLSHAGCINKYPGRALLITSGSCPVHCRYCFRRAFPYTEQLAARNDWRGAIETIKNTPHLREVILSGGDPLSLGNRKLANLIEKIESIEKVETLRIHTRFPIVLPDRVDRGLVELLTASRLGIVVVLHTNHPAEIDRNVEAAASALKQSSNLLLNQAVLLKGVNDDAETLIALSRRLLDIGVAPYYLHLLDRVTGTAHFAIEDKRAIELIEAMRRRAPGYLVPRLVRDRAGELSKTPMA